MTREEIEKQIADAEVKLAALREELAKQPKRETVRRERWVNHYRGGVSFIVYLNCESADFYAGDDGECRLGPAERIVREFDLVDGKCVEQRCGLTGRVIWREGGAARVEKPETLMASEGGGYAAAWCETTANGDRVVCCTDWARVDVITRTAWLRRAVAWVNDGEVGR